MIPTAAANGAAIVTVPMAGYVAADGNGTVDETEIAPSPRWKQVVPKSRRSSRPRRQSRRSEFQRRRPFPTKATATSSPTSSPIGSTLQGRAGKESSTASTTSRASGAKTLPAGWQSGVEPMPWLNPPSRRSRPAPAVARIRRSIPTSRPLPRLRRQDDRTRRGDQRRVPDATGLRRRRLRLERLRVAAGRARRQPASAPSHPAATNVRRNALQRVPARRSPQADQQHFTPAELAQGKTLMDVLDLHWYPEARSGTNPNAGTRITENNNSAAVVAARVQAPRSLWDPTYTETSWISQWGTWVGSPGNHGPDPTAAARPARHRRLQARHRDRHHRIQLRRRQPHLRRHRRGRRARHLRPRGRLRRQLVGARQRLELRQRRLQHVPQLRRRRRQIRRHLDRRRHLEHRQLRRLRQRRLERSQSHGRRRHQPHGERRSPPASRSRTTASSTTPRSTGSPAARPASCGRPTSSSTSSTPSNTRCPPTASRRWC